MKSVIAVMLASLILGLGWVGFASGGSLVFNPEVRFVTSAGDTIYLEEDTDAKTVLVYASNFNISGASINSLCDIDSKYLDAYKNLYFFEIDYGNDLNCNNGNIVLELDGEIYGNTIHTLNVTKGSSVFDRYLDYANSDLEDVLDELEYDLSSNSIFKNYNNIDIAKNFKYYKGKNIYKNAQLHDRIIRLILDGREQKYLIPVEGRSFSTEPTKLPNSGRPYRAAYTDGIHYGFDIDGSFGDRAIALDTGLVVRVVDGFQDSDFSRIVYGDNLSREQELKNLDILRGNQVWIKTLKGDVVFYSHLDIVSSNMKVGELVKKGDFVATTGVTGVPEKGYDDYHLHFAVMVNPHNILTAGSYDFGDYMSWDYLGKGKSYNQLLEIIDTTFE